MLYKAKRGTLCPMVTSCGYRTLLFSPGTASSTPNSVLLVCEVRWKEPSPLTRDICNHNFYKYKPKVSMEMKDNNRPHIFLRTPRVQWKFRTEVIIPLILIMVP